MDAQEQERRETCGARLIALFQRLPLVWIPMKDMHAAGDAWRSRLPKIRRQFSRDNVGIVKWNGKNGIASAYMFIPHVPLGRDASERIQQKSLF